MDEWAACGWSFFFDKKELKRLFYNANVLCLFKNCIIVTGNEFDLKGEHPCEVIYRLSSRPIYGSLDGVCRITGKVSKGLSFKSWVKPTFTDHASLLPGDIISNEALFCFDEASDEIMKLTGRDKPQRFRTYSHVVYDGVWKCYTKANKREIFEAIIAGAELVCLTDSGQRHILFKHRVGMWQLDDLFLIPDLDLFKKVHGLMMELLELGFTQSAILTGTYNLNYLIKNGAEKWAELEKECKKYRGTGMWDFAGWMLYKNAN
jgi:hypothetical protein